MRPHKKKVVGTLKTVDKRAFVAVGAIVLAIGILLWAIFGLVSGFEIPGFPDFGDLFGDIGTIIAPAATPAAAPQPTDPTTPTEDHPLVGTWAWDGNSAWRYVFQENGEATRGVGGAQSFRWWVEDGNVTMAFNGRQERWTYVVDGDSLTLTSGRSTYHYYRVN